MKRIAYFIFLIFLSAQGFCQANRWIKKYPFSGGNTYGDGYAFIIEDYDKGFFIANQGVNGFNASYGIRVLKTDVNGNILWERFIGQGKLMATLEGAAISSDGGFLIEGAIAKTDSTNDNYLMKINACGQVDWCKIYDLNQYSVGGRVGVLNNGDIVVSSYVAINKIINKDSIIGNYYNSWMFRTDPNGNIKWQVFDNLTTWDLKIGNNQQIFRTGACDVPYMGNSNILVIECGLIKMDSSGKRTWYAEYNNKANIAADGVNSVQTSDNGYLTLADQRNLNAVMLIKFNSNGAAQWTKLIGDTQTDEFCWGMSQVNDSSYLVLAATNIDQHGQSVNDLKMLKINEQGQVLKRVIFPDTGYHEWLFYCPGVTSDHKYTVIGTGNYGGTRDSILVLKYNENLDLDTFYSHDTNKYDYLCNHKITYDSTIYFNTSNPVPITVPFPLDTETIINPGSFAIYPNPSSGFINILCPNANIPATATIYDMPGRLIGKYNFSPGNFGQARLNLPTLAPGCYVMVLEQEGKRYVQKLVVE